MEEEIGNRFCIKGDLQLKCKDPIFKEFEDEIDLIKVLLSYLKTYLPEIMFTKTDCRNRNIKIDPNDIGVRPQKDFGNYIILLVPTDDNSSYNDTRFYMENSEYGFQIQMQVSDDDSEGALENLIKLKSGVKTLLVNIEDNLGISIVIDGFSYSGPFNLENTKKFVRQGIYRFSVIQNKYRN